jgi:hypothetical protein
MTHWEARGWRWRTCLLPRRMTTGGWARCFYERVTTHAVALGFHHWSEHRVARRRVWED